MSASCVQITVPGEDRYEPPVPLQLPEPSTHPQALYRVTLGEEGGDFTLVVRRPAGAAVKRVLPPYDRECCCTTYSVY